MIKAEVRIINKLGLHARPAQKLVKIASISKSQVMVIKNGQRVNARSILGVLLLQAEQGSKITIEVTGEDEEQVLTDLLNLINNKFDEE